MKNFFKIIGYHIVHFTKQFIIALLVAITIAVLGLNSDFFSKLFSNSKDPYFELENWRIEAKNDKWKSLDTINLKYKYRGQEVTLLPDFKITDYNISNSNILTSYDDLDVSPSIELVEPLIDQAIIDSINKKGIIKVELRKRMILKGFNLAYFEESDKVQLGHIKLRIGYLKNEDTIRKTVRSNIYLVK